MALGEKTKKALLVGIDKYTDERIDNLKGAENDAVELEALLKKEFEIISLINENATSENIRIALSDLFWKQDECELILFYFSGHGFYDDYGQGYFAPTDFNKDSPIVCGLNMRETREIITDSKGKKNILLISDCCFSGITAEAKGGGTKDISMSTVLRVEEDTQNTFILTSSTAQQKSREKTNCIDENKPTHAHGMFTYHLLEGLRGGATNETEAGYVYLDKLARYIQDQFINEQASPIFSEKATGARLGIIRDTRYYGKFLDIRFKIIDKTLKDCQKQGFATLITEGLQAIKELIEKFPENPKTLEKVKEIDTILKVLKKESIDKWWLENNPQVYSKSPTGALTLDNLIPKVTNCKDMLHFNQDELYVFLDLSNAATEKITLERFCDKCRQRFDSTPNRNRPSAEASAEDKPGKRGMHDRP